MKVSNSSQIRDKFTELATSTLGKRLPIFIAQEDSNTTKFKLGDIYSFGDYSVKVTDISPYDQNTFSFDYLPDTAKNILSKAKRAVSIKLVPYFEKPADDMDVFKFGTKFTSVSGSYLKQTIIANVKQGDVVFRGDVIAFNTGFFELDPFDPKQVTWKHGIMTRVALMECDGTIEDASAITEELSRRLEMQPAHLRTLELNSKTILKDLVTVGTEVQTTDLLCTLEDSDIGSLTDSDDTSVLDLLTELNRKAPRARYHGIVSEIDVLYSCAIEDMHPSVAELVKKINQHKHQLSKAAKNTNKNTYYAEPSQIQVGTKYRGVEFGTDTIILMVYISESIDMDVGSKLVLMNQAKSVCSAVIEKPISTISGYPVDMIFSARGISNRILLSPTIVGFTNRCLVKLEELSIQKYFSE